MPADLLAERPEFLELFESLSLTQDLLDLALSIMEGLRQIFGSGGTDHPLFQKTGLKPEVYETVLRAMDDRKAGRPMQEHAQALILSVPASITAEQVGPAFRDRVKDRILHLREIHSTTLRTQMAELYSEIAPDAPLLGFSVLENAIFGKVSEEAGPRAEEIRQVVAQVLADQGITRQVLELVFDVPISLGGSNLPAAFAEPLAVSRAAIKRPDILVLDQVMTSFDAATRQNMIAALREELPDSTFIYLTAQPEENMDFDLTLDIQQGRLTGADAMEKDTDQDDDVAADLARKVQALQQTPFFSELDRKQLRLLAFGSRWYREQSGEYVFHKNDDPTDGAYMVIEGEADLLLPQGDAEDTLIATVGAGALVGELGLIRSEPRALDMRAKTDLTCLRIGEEEFMAVVENDAATAFRLLQVVAGYVKT